MRRVTGVVVMALLALAIIANGALGVGIVLTREPEPKPLTAERVATASKPAIVFIQSNYTISTSMPAQTITDETKQTIANQLQPLWDSGQISTRAEWDRRWYQTIVNNPDAYYSVGAILHDQWHDWVTGSGFFVTEDGYLVTAAHVVTAAKSDVHDGIVAETKSAQWVADLKTRLRQHWEPVYAISDAELDKLVDFNQRWVARYLTVDNIDAAYHLGTGATVEAGDSLVANGVNATVAGIDPAVGGHDVAILKAEVTGVPALALAASDPKLGDATYAIGYPRTSFQAYTPTRNNRPIVVTVGTIQHMQSSSGPAGTYKVFGTDAQLQHGDSGGPVVDARGDVLGVMSFIVPDANGNMLPGQGYFEPSSWVRQDLRNAKVTISGDPQRSNLTNTYYRALAKGDAGRYREELGLLLSVRARSVLNGYVNADISHVQDEIAAGHDTTPPNLAVYVLPGAGAAAAVILMALLSWLVLSLMIGYQRRPAVLSAVPPEPVPGVVASAD